MAATTCQYRSRLALCLVKSRLPPCCNSSTICTAQQALRRPLGGQATQRLTLPDPPSKSKPGRWGWGGVVLPWNSLLRCAANCGLRRRRRRACVVILQVSHPPVSNHRPRVLQHAAIRRRQLGLPGNCTSRLTPYMKPFFRIGRWPGCPRASNLGKTLRTACAGAPATPRCQASQQVPS